MLLPPCARLSLPIRTVYQLLGTLDQSCVVLVEVMGILYFLSELPDSSFTEIDVHVNFLAPDIFMAQLPVLNNVICDKKIGEGGFGVVYRGVLKNTKNHTEITVAVKSMKTSQEIFTDSVQRYLDIK